MRDVDGGGQLVVVDTRVKSNSRSSPSAIASMRVSWSKLSWTRRRIGLDDVEEDVRLEPLVMGQEEIREEVVVAFVQLVEVHDGPLPRPGPRGRMASGAIPGPSIRQ